MQADETGGVRELLCKYVCCVQGKETEKNGGSEGCFSNQMDRSGEQLDVEGERAVARFHLLSLVRFQERHIPVNCFPFLDCGLFLGKVFS